MGDCGVAVLGKGTPFPADCALPRSLWWALNPKLSPGWSTSIHSCQSVQNYPAAVCADRSKQDSATHHQHLQPPFVGVTVAVPTPAQPASWLGWGLALTRCAYCNGIGAPGSNAFDRQLSGSAPRRRPSSARSRITSTSNSPSPCFSA